MRRLSGSDITLVGLLVLAAGLRFYKLDAQSLWYDEGNSARIAERSVQLIIAGAAADIHPPLYYLVLKFWRALFGSSEFGLRSLSVVCGVLLVLFAFLIGRDWFNKRVGLIAAFLVCISPFSIYYSQETRMYALLATLAAATTWLLMRLNQSVTRRQVIGFGAGYVLATAAALYTQYAYPFVMVAQGSCALLWLGSLGYVRRTSAIRSPVRRTLIFYALLNVVPLLLYAPWLPIAIRQIRGWVVAPQGYELGPAVLDSLRWLTVGRTLPMSEAVWPMLAFGLCIVCGLFLARRSGGMETDTYPPFLHSSVLVILALLPLVLLFTFKLYRDAYLKFLLVCIAPLCLLAANGIDAISENVKGKRQKISGGLISAFCLLPFTFLLLPSLNNLYNNPAYARDDYRSIAKLIRVGEREDDAVLFIAPNQWEVFTYYYTDTQRTFALKYRPTSEAEAEAELQKATHDKNRLFVLYFAEKEADPAGWYEQWLAFHAYKANEQWLGNIRLAVYAAKQPTAISNQRLGFGGQIELVSTHVNPSPSAVGDVLPIALRWRAQHKLDKAYKVFIHIGKADAPPVAQNDSEPMAGYLPTTTWGEGAVIQDNRAVWIHPGTPPGHYAIYVGLYDASTGERLKLQDGSDRLKIGDIAITE